MARTSPPHGVPALATALTLDGIQREMDEAARKLLLRHLAALVYTHSRPSSQLR